MRTNHNDRDGIDQRLVPMGRAYKLSKDILFYGDYFELETIKEIANEIMERITDSSDFLGYNMEDIRELDSLIARLEMQGDFKKYPLKDQ